MPSESVGTCGVAQWPDREQIGRELEFGIACLRLLCGPEPAGSSLEVTWQDHDSGQYAEISLVWPSGTPVGLSRYLEQCEEALDRVDKCIAWQGLLEAVGPQQRNSPRDSKEGRVRQPESGWSSVTTSVAYVAIGGKTRAVDPRALYCQCCPHRPQPAYPDLHYPFVNCNCCPRMLPQHAYDPISRTVRRCEACRRREWELGSVGAFLGAVATAWLGAILVEGWVALLIGGMMAAVGAGLTAYLWWSRRHNSTAFPPLP